MNNEDARREKVKQDRFEALLSADAAQRFGGAQSTRDSRIAKLPGSTTPIAAPSRDSKGLAILEFFANFIPAEFFVVFIILAAVVLLVVDLLDF